MKVTTTHLLTGMAGDVNEIEISWERAAIVMVSQDNGQLLIHCDDVHAFCDELLRFAERANPDPKPFTVEAGRRYKQRDGLKSGLIEPHDNAFYPFFDPVSEMIYTREGFRFSLVEPSQYDLVAIWPEDAP